MAVQAPGVEAMSQQNALNVDAFTQFIAVSALISLLDPVRGEPTVHSLDRHPDDSTGGHDRLQTRFLDSFALISSTERKGGKTASAVCLEQDQSGATTLRLARNLGVPGDLTNRLQVVLDKLTAIALQGRTTPELEDDILYDIIDMTKDKIRCLLEWICKTKVRQEVDRAMEAMEHGASYQDADKNSGFRCWIKKLPSLVSLAVDTGPQVLIHHIKWASRARWAYSEQLKSFLSSHQGDTPLWINGIYKLGRYYAAAQAMVKLASKQPELFRRIRIAPVECPSPQPFALKDRNALASLLKRLGKGGDLDHLMSELARSWFVNGSEGDSRKDPEDHFRKQCRLTLTVHAEMQLLNFYVLRPELTPRLLFMGTSKKACYLCDKFLSQHPLKMIVSASHQKIWPSWMPPPSTGSSIRVHRNILWDMKRELERTAARELQGELGRRRPAQLDSTAGPPITFTSTFRTAPAISDQGTRHNPG